MMFVLAPELTVASDPRADRLRALLSLRVRKDRLLFLRCKASCCCTAAIDMVRGIWMDVWMEWDVGVVECGVVNAMLSVGAL